MNNQECKTRPQIINFNGDEPVVFSFVKLRKIVNPMKNNISINPIIFIYTMLFFFIKYL